MQFNWGGKIILGLLGMLVGGPIGLGIGLLIGHMLDKGAEQVRTFNPFRPYGPGEQQAVQKALTDRGTPLRRHRSAMPWAWKWTQPQSQ